jgi:pimeloyl-ACP methyl ester carboxylesterase
MRFSDPTAMRANPSLAKAIPHAPALTLVAALMASMGPFRNANAATAPQDRTSATALIASEGYFYVGGRYFDAPEGTFMAGQMYVEYKIPRELRHPYPIVMFSGLGQSGLNYTATPDGRPGWAYDFLREGYAVYLLDQPSRGRSAHQPEDGDTVRLSTKMVQSLFTAPERANLWPQAKLHTQWPGAGAAGDSVFDQFFAQTLPSLSIVHKQQEVNRDAGVALLEKIGPAILMTHSQAALFGWLITDARPTLVKAIVALEPSGPPVHENATIGAPEWFREGPVTKPFGLTSLPLTYDPPVKDAGELSFTREAAPDTPEQIPCWLQSEPARKLHNLTTIPILVVQSEASYHAVYDQCTVKYLRQAGANRTTFLRLADVGVHGNGHMLMLEKNSSDIAALIAHWLEREKKTEP